MDLYEEHVTGEPGRRWPIPTEGVEGGFQPLTTLIDCFVGSLQLAQILLYELDGIHRAVSNTLWMRQTVLEAARPQAPGPEGHDGPRQLTTTLADPTVLTKDGTNWRTAEILGRLDGVSLRCAVAHQLL
jgi:hypothetical protein